VIQSKVHEYAHALYHALDAAATTEPLDGQDARIFRGSVVRTYRSLDISNSYYSEVRRFLLETESVTFIRQGSRGNESVIVLHKEPDANSIVTLQSLGLTREVEAGRVFQELRDLRRLIGSISIPDALVNIEQRLQEMEHRITRVEQQLNQKQGR
jgi:hypothetical protein